MAWHPTSPGLLMVQCINQEGIFYVWDEQESEPRVNLAPFKKLLGRSEARWISDTRSQETNLEPSDIPREKDAMVYFGDTTQYVLISAAGSDVTFNGEATSLPGGDLGGVESDERLNRKTPPQTVEPHGAIDDVSRLSPSRTHPFDEGPEMDDTFRFQRHITESRFQ
ncbi:MAG: snoRNA-binding rRNA-processing protein utp10 [Chaenotheca gracillima]|nr:MAG: snoRNA-binding rRNA-processing protein utp10 [Chaenotheca gracillima]